MFTADMARAHQRDDLDEKIQRAVTESSGRSASIRIYHDDWYCYSIGEELEKRGFKNIRVPVIVLKGDVYFEW